MANFSVGDKVVTTKAIVSGNSVVAAGAKCTVTSVPPHGLKHYRVRFEDKSVAKVMPGDIRPQEKPKA